MEENQSRVITFGGAFSNHIVATAAACRKYNLESIGIIRGEEDASNPSLKQAIDNGMQLHFVNRETYSGKEGPELKKELEQRFGRHYQIPEGGNNSEGIRGCAEILRPEWNYDLVACACGTGATFSGLMASKKANQSIVGVSVLKGENKLSSDLMKMNAGPFKRAAVAGNEVLEKEFIEEDCIINTYAFKGYAKYDEKLVGFKSKFELEYGIPLDHVYTAKLMYAVFDLIEKSKFRAGVKVLAIHSGGLQGNKGFEERYHLTPSR